MCRWQSALALGCLVTIAGCSGAKDEPDPAQAAAAESKLKVALLTPSPISDAGWSAMAYEGLKAVEKELGAEVRNQEAKSAQIPDAMRSYAQKGFRIVFGHGYEYNEPSIRVAKDFPETVFVSSSGGHTADNVGAFRFALEEGFFLAGMAAAKLSKSGAVGMVGATMSLRFVQPSRPSPPERGRSIQKSRSVKSSPGAEATPRPRSARRSN